MRKVVLVIAALLAVAVAGGCNRKPAAAASNDGVSNEAAQNEALNAIAEDTTPMSNADRADLTAAANDDAAANWVARKAGQSLSLYVGHYPFDKIGGTSFRDDPIVKRAVIEAVPDLEIRNFVLRSSGPQSQIKVKDGKILAWGCQAHDCGAHQWAISVAPDGGNAEICYFDSENPETGKAKYFSRGGKMVERLGQCPSPAV